MGMNARNPSHGYPHSHRVGHYPPHTTADVLAHAEWAGRARKQDVPVLCADHRGEPALLQRPLSHATVQPEPAMSTTWMFRTPSLECDRSMRSAAISSIAAASNNSSLRAAGSVPGAR